MRDIQGWLVRGLTVILLTASRTWAEIPKTISYQGVVAVNGTRYDGPGTFYFALLGASGNNVWTNDGTSMGNANRPLAGVELTVTDGVFSVMLGGPEPSMTAISPVLFQQTDIALRIWFDDGDNGVQQLSPDVPLASVPYAHAVHGIAVTQVGDQERVGINTPTPSSETTLHVLGTGTTIANDTGRIRLESFDHQRIVDLRTDGQHIDIESKTSNIWINNVASSGPNQGNVFINPHASGGKVGIGTAAPNWKLDVAGDVNVSGTFLIDQKKPFLRRNICNKTGNNGFMDTGIAVAEYSCWVGGFSSRSGIIRTSLADPIFVVLQNAGGNWVLFADFASVADHEEWDVVVLCVRSELVEVRPDIGTCEPRQ